MQTSLIDRPGATLYAEVRGAGPLLLLVCGGPQDAGVFTALAEQLAAHYTVVTYDPRGNSRSAFTGPLSLDEQADDAAALIRAHGGGPARVFGTSGGAHIALHLAARQRELVHCVVAHEPPTMRLLADPSAALASVQRLHDIYEREGIASAMHAFFAENGLSHDDAAPPPSPDEQATFARVSGNFEYWLAHGLLPLSHFVPDVAALRGVRIVVGIGERSTGQPIAAMATALADALGSAPHTFPGDHVTFDAAFAVTLHHVLEAP